MKHAFSRSVAIRHLVCGSCNGCEHELNALAGPDYDITAEGFDIVASPRHADVVTVAGPMSDAMRAPARATLDAVAHPCIVVAIGDCACWGPGIRTTWTSWWIWTVLTPPPGCSGALWSPRLGFWISSR